MHEPNFAGAKNSLCVEADHLQQWHALFVEAEKRIKEIEYCREGLDIPAVNELRYVAFHLLEVLAANDATKDEKCRRVVSHLQRAIYDACEALITLQLSELRKFREDYRLVTVSDVVPDYHDLMKRADKANEMLTAGRNSHDSREAFYNDALKHVDELKEINTSLRVAREELNKTVRQARNGAIAWVVGTIIATAGAVATIIQAVAG